MNLNGYNPLRWDCNAQGCFNQKRRPKIEVFSDCFPGRINFGDVDGIVEIAGYGLLLEWKSVASLPTGQRIMYERLTSGGVLSVVVVVGDADTMEVRAFSWIKDGKQAGWANGNLSVLKACIKNWCEEVLRIDRMA